MGTGYIEVFHELYTHLAITLTELTDSTKHQGEQHRFILFQPETQRQGNAVMLLFLCHFVIV